MESLLDMLAMAPDDELQSAVADLRYLQSRGILQLMMPSEEIREEYEDELLEYWLAVEDASDPILLNIPGNDPGPNELLERSIQAVVGSDRLTQEESRKSDARARLTAMQLRLAGVNAVPVLSSIGSLPSTNSAPTMVAQVTLEALPVPQEDTPLEGILEFRENEEAVGSVAALRRWMRKSGLEVVSYSNLKEELEELLDAYTRNMRLHRMRYRNVRWRTFVTLPLELLENVAKLKLSAIAAKPFDIREAKINLLQDELTAPGNEVAYIVHARAEYPLAEPAVTTPPQPKTRPPRETQRVDLNEETNGIVEFFREQGYSVRRGGLSVGFIAERGKFLMSRSEADPNYFVLYYPGFWSLAEDDVGVALVMANMASKTCKGVKVLLERDDESNLHRASARVEALFADADMFKKNFPRLMDMIRCGVDTLIEGMRRYKENKGKSE